MTFKNQKEFNLLVQIIKGFLETKNSPYNFENIHWKEFIRLVNYHGMNHLILFDKELMDQLPYTIKEKQKKFSENRARLLLENTLEIKKLYQIFYQENLNPLLLKGTLFPFYIHTRKFYRTSTDIDFLFKKEEVIPAIKILLKRGYKIRNFGNLYLLKNLEEEIKSFVEDSGFSELHLDKKPFNIDLHWNLNHHFKQYHFPIEKLFEEKTKINFHGMEIEAISNENFFWSLINHHGGKEYWLRMKNLVDLALYLKANQNTLNWDIIKKNAQEYGFETSLRNGLYFTKIVFEFELNPEIDSYIENYTPKAKNSIIQFWHKANYWNKVIPRLKYEYILFKSREKGFYWLKYFFEFYIAYSKTNSFERKRLTNRFSKFPILNFGDKVLSWLFRKTK